MKSFGHKIESNYRIPVAGVVASQSLPELPPGEEIYDLMPFAKLAFPWLYWFLQLLIFLFAIFVFFKLWRWLNTEPEKVRKPIIQSPEKQAERALRRLKLSPVWNNRQMKEICEVLVKILKTFIKQKYDIGLGAAATSDEMMESLNKENIAKGVLKDIGDLFNTCDRIKYTGKTYEADAEKLASLVKKLILSRRWQT
ncbi:MAG: hypothetical protein ACQETH_09050 [Candidatus Rifleibacteriota bacterium]